MMQEACRLIIDTAIEENIQTKKEMEKLKNRICRQKKWRFTGLRMKSRI